MPCRKIHPNQGDSCLDNNQQQKQTQHAQKQHTQNTHKDKQETPEQHKGIQHIKTHTKKHKPNTNTKQETQTTHTISKTQ